MVRATAEPVGTLEVALAHAARLLGEDPLLAAEQATEILKAIPGQRNAALLLGIARRTAGDLQGAYSALEPLVQAHPRWAPAHCELGLTLGALGRGEQAVTSLRQAVELSPGLADAWRALADHLDAMGDHTGADTARGHFIKASTKDPRLLSAAAALSENRIPEAEALLRRHLSEFPTDVAAIRMFAEVAGRLGRYRDAENLLTRCLELAPSFHAARHNYAVVLFRQANPAAALPEVERLLAVEPRNPNYRSLHAAVLAGIGEYTRALEIYAGILKEYPNQAKIWLSYGHALKTAGQSAEGIAAYRRTLELDPRLGEAWWSLANLKTFRFSPEDLTRMRHELARSDLADEDRMHFHFALGKALEDARDYATSFEHYREGNALRRAVIHYDAGQTRAYLERARKFFTAEFFSAHAGAGSPAPDPIFIVGLPRSGSTLLEQILSSHSSVEGTMELPDIAAMARSLVGDKRTPEGPRYPEVLATLDPHELRRLGEKYLTDTRVQRKSDAPFFIDKMPNNFLHVGLIHLILPNAKIIDARRHPLACCFSGFKQHFARGQNFSYDLTDLGAYYRDYVELMAHFDRVLPGRVHRVFYEHLVENTEYEVRRLLNYCGLTFEPACLRFYENERAVRTASSEQVRTPIYREGVDQWRHYEPWLGPLKAALGRIAEAYPELPEDLTH